MEIKLYMNGDRGVKYHIFLYIFVTINSQNKILSKIKYFFRS